jgi:hypothetical protein
MNKPAKKPAVVAKTAPKKRGRPVGSKSKKEITKDPFNGDTVNWQKLSQQLQVALAAEMKDNEEQQDFIDNMVAEALRNRTFYERLVCLFTGKV